MAIFQFGCCSRRNAYRDFNPAPPLLIYLKTLKSPIYENLSQEEKTSLKKNATRHWYKLKRLYEKHKKMDFDPHNPYQSNYELDTEIYENLIKAFKEIYPEDYKKLEKIQSKERQSSANELNNKVVYRIPSLY